MKPFRSRPTLPLLLWLATSVGCVAYRPMALDIAVDPSAASDEALAAATLRNLVENGYRLAVEVDAHYSRASTLISADGRTRAYVYRANGGARGRPWATLVFRQGDAARLAAFAVDGSSAGPGKLTHHLRARSLSWCLVDTDSEPSLEDGGLRLERSANSVADAAIDYCLQRTGGSVEMLMWFTSRADLEETAGLMLGLFPGLELEAPGTGS